MTTRPAGNESGHGSGIPAGTSIPASLYDLSHGQRQDFCCMGGSVVVEPKAYGAIQYRAYVLGASSY